MAQATTNPVVSEEYVSLLLKLGITDLESTLLFLENAKTKTAAVKTFIRRLERLLFDYNYHTRIEVDKEPLVVITNYLQAALDHIVQCLPNESERDDDFNQKTNNCQEYLKKLKIQQKSKKFVTGSNMIAFPIKDSNGTRSYEVDSLAHYFFFLFDLFASGLLPDVKKAVENTSKGEKYSERIVPFKNTLEKLYSFVLNNTQKEISLVKINDLLKYILHGNAQTIRPKQYIENIFALLEHFERLLISLATTYKVNLGNLEKSNDGLCENGVEVHFKVASPTKVKNAIKYEQLEEELKIERRKNLELKRVIEEQKNEITDLKKNNKDFQDSITKMYQDMVIRDFGTKLPVPSGNSKSEEISDIGVQEQED